MYDLHNMLNRYYDDHVRLGKARRDALAANRESCLARLVIGLDALGYPSGFEHVNQGSYAMHTQNQYPNNDYDIDVGLIFSSDDLPSTALASRQRIAAAMCKGGGNFSREPEAKTNAVRVYYAAGHHVDFAVYRRSLNWLGQAVIEHASSEWAHRDPYKITEWYRNSVATLSPSGDHVTVADAQLRRITRLAKAMVKVRETSNLPGGLIISTLVVEQYRPHSSRDDIAFAATISAIRSRLFWNSDVLNPVDPSKSLTSKLKHQQQVTNLSNLLGQLSADFDALQNDSTTEGDALNAMSSVFLHRFWSLAASAKAYGVASEMGSLYVARETGSLSSPSSPNSIQSPPHRFFGI